MQFDLAIDASRANEKNKTGVGVYCYALIQELKKIIPESINVVLYSREPLTNGLEKLPPNWQSKVLGWPPKLLWTQIRLSWEMLTHSPKILFVPAHVLPLILPNKSAVTIHDVAFTEFKEAFSWSENWYQNFAVKLAIRNATRIFTISNFSKSELINKFQATENKIAVTHLACDTEKFGLATDQDVVRRLAKYDLLNRPYFLCVGRVEHKKNIATIIEAFFKFVAKTNDLQTRLVLAGGHGFGYEQEMGQFAQHPLRERIMELGYVPEADLPAMYKAAKVLMFMSFYEGFGMPVLEAFASGVPVIASNISSISEVAGEAAILVDPLDSDAIAAEMNKLLVDSSYRDSYIKKGLERVQTFSWVNTANETWAELGKLLN